jgi:MerR family transcriptional regulator, copper efflux regulator
LNTRYNLDIYVKVKDDLGMNIGELVKATGTSARSIRHYEAEGLLFSKRLDNSYRDFDGAAIETIRQIGLLLEMGLSIKVIRELAPCFPRDSESMGVCPKIRATLLNHRSSLKDRHLGLGKLIKRIDSILDVSPT